ncbi:Lmo0850 family protein [Listeria kieliensis]
MKPFSGNGVIEKMSKDPKKMDKVVQNLKSKGISVEKTKSRKELWQTIQLNPLPQVEFSLH